MSANKKLLKTDKESKAVNKNSLQPITHLMLWISHTPDKKDASQKSLNFSAEGATYPSR